MARHGRVGRRTLRAVLPLALFLAAAVTQRPATASQVPHPAIVRVVVPQRDATSYGSGALVEVGDQYGLVITNWHVVRDAGGPISVIFPGGFRTGATVLKTDADWDLAALGIWKPPVSPLPISTVPPQTHEPLAIAGYGSGAYRLATGRCTQYYSPGKNLPHEIVEVSVAARNGDSGGPILNQRGEVAGILFGEGRGKTAGSYGGRVERFVADVRPLVGGSTAIARARGPERSEPTGGWQQATAIPIAQSKPSPPAPSAIAAMPPPQMPGQPPMQQPTAAATRAGGNFLTSRPAPPQRPLTAAAPPPRLPVEPAVAAPVAKDSDLAAELLGRTPWEKFKSAMAGIGALALFLLTSRAFRR